MLVMSPVGSGGSWGAFLFPLNPPSPGSFLVVRGELLAEANLWKFFHTAGLMNTVLEMMCGAQQKLLLTVSVMAAALGENLATLL